MWGILNTLNTSDVDEVTIDSGANWKAAKSPSNPGIKVSSLVSDFSKLTPYTRIPDQIYSWYGFCLCKSLLGRSHAPLHFYHKAALLCSS